MKVEVPHHYRRWLINLVSLVVAFIFLMSLGRIFFAFYFGDIATISKNLPDFLSALVLGLRFDLMPLAYVNFLPFLFLHVGYLFYKKIPLKLVRSLIISFLLIGYVLIFWIYVFDYAFYSYFQDHINVLIFGFFEDDTLALLKSIYKNYNLFLWLPALFGAHLIFHKFIKFCFSLYDFDLNFNYKPVLVLGQFTLGTFLLTFMARGNLGRLPLSIDHAFISEIKFINEISLNGVITLNRALKIRKTFGKDEIDYLRFYGINTWREAFQILKKTDPKEDTLFRALLRKSKINQNLDKHPPHVVLVIMESFGSFWNDQEREDFQLLGALKRHFNDGILFKNFLPSENGTIGSLMSILTAQPIRPGARFLSESEFKDISMYSSGNRPFQEKGYEAHFVYGGNLGWRNIGQFLSFQKYSKLWGADEIVKELPNLKKVQSQDLGNEWGIYDEYLYNFLEKKLLAASVPQLFVVLTTTNHPPFEYPSTYRPLPLNLTPELLSRLTVNEDLARKRFLTFQYANQKVADFIDKIKSTPLGKKTIIAITGDHSFWISKGVDQSQEFKRYAVPFFLSVPEAYRPESIDMDKFASHEDIFPTLINLSLSDQNYINLGEDLFNEDSFALNSSGLVANKKGAIHHERAWIWENLDQLILAPSTDSSVLEELKNRSQGLIGLTDAYLKDEKSDMRIGANNDR